MLPRPYYRHNSLGYPTALSYAARPVSISEGLGCELPGYRKCTTHKVADHRHLIRC